MQHSDSDLFRVGWLSPCVSSQETSFNFVFHPCEQFHQFNTKTFSFRHKNLKRMCQEATSEFYFNFSKEIVHREALLLYLSNNKKKYEGAICKLQS